MSANLEYSALTRLLTLNNQTHDLRRQLLGESVPQGRALLDSMARPSAPNVIAEMQEAIDRSVRASLTTCWLGGSNGQEP